jgi:DNA-binding NarL/FixJ family response regulator
MMVSSTVNLEGQPSDSPTCETKPPVRVIVADSQTIFRVGLRKIFALEDDIRVVGQAESFGQAIAAIARFDSEVILFEAALAADPAEAVSELLHRAPNSKLVVLTADAKEDQTLEFLRRGAHGIVERAIAPELLVKCLRRVAEGEIWLDRRGVNWVLNAYRTQASRPVSTAPKVHLTQKEMLIISCVAQGMKNKEIAQRVNTTEQVVKNYLRKVYDKLGVSDRLELALYCLHHRLLDGAEAMLTLNPQPSRTKVEVPVPVVPSEPIS